LVGAVAGRVLRHLRDESLRVPQQHVLERPATLELLPQHVSPHTVALTRQLHDGFERSADTPHEDVDAEHAFVAYHPDLDITAVLEYGDD
jgi:hypothetical protein